MSVVTAVRKDREICISTDSQTNFGSTILNGNHLQNFTKLFQVNDSIIGLVGWHALYLVFEHLIQKNSKMFKLNSCMEIFNTLLEFQNILKDEYFIDISDDEDDRPVESNHLTGLIINKNGLFKIDSYREVFEFKDFWTIGSGYRFALGAMHALYDKDYTAQYIAEAGVNAAVEYNDGCGNPIQSKIIEL